jgi:hypothetical protein
MIQTEIIDTQNKVQVKEFVDFHYRLYEGTPQWVPPFYSDIWLMLNKNKHPFYERNDADFILAKKGNEVVARLAIMENRAFNDYHKVKKAQFYLFDSVDDQEAANAVFERASDWAKKRKLNHYVGPKGFSPFDGYGILVEGYDQHQMMTMMNYNFPYYPRLMEAQGFKKEVDFVSCYLAKEHFNIPEKVREVARKVEERGTLKIKNFSSKKELKEWAQRIGQAYNKTFVNNWEYYPFTEGEINLALDGLLLVAVPSLIKLITHQDEVVGFLLGFPDITKALQRQKGDVSLWKPWGIIDIMNEIKRTNWISLNGAGVLPEFQGRGGNALMYAEMEKSIKAGHFEHGELTQVAETAVQMRKDLKTLGGIEYKNHRIFHRDV